MRLSVVLVVLVALAALCCRHISAMECNHVLYCNATFLQRLLPLFPDTKLLVDSATRVPIAHVQHGFDQIVNALSADPALNSSALWTGFSARYFQAAGAELRAVVPPDFNQTAVLFPRLAKASTAMAGFVQDVHFQWAMLTRVGNLSSTVCQDCASSLISLPHPFVVPGGRFHGIYYWDSYWILKGLYVSQMFATAKGMVLNLLHLVDQFGFVPNGNRIYYTNRSQPPLLALILRDYVLATRDLVTLRTGIRAVEKEWQFWMKERLVMPIGRGLRFGLNGYRSTTANHPRWESFHADWTVAQHVPEPLREHLFRDLTAAAESGILQHFLFHSDTYFNILGWDFSSRWMKADPRHSGGGNQTRSLADLETGQIVPVDLNAILFAMELFLVQSHKFLQCAGATNESHTVDRSCWYVWDLPLPEVPVETSRPLGMMVPPWNASDSGQQSAFFTYAAQLRRQLVTDFLWSSKHKRFLDYDLLLRAQRGLEYGDFPSTLVPLWTEAYRADLIPAEDLLEMLQQLNRTMLSAFPGGVPTSTTFSGQQWDFPNAWPPLQWIAVEALLNFVRLNPRLLSRAGWIQDVADSIVGRFVRTTFCGYRQKSPAYKHRRRKRAASTASVSGAAAMFEKYDVRGLGVPGDGGEYVIQAGFGWTNGVLLDFLARHGDRASVHAFIQQVPSMRCPSVQEWLDSRSARFPSLSNSVDIQWNHASIVVVFILAAIFLALWFEFRRWRMERRMERFRNRKRTPSNPRRRTADIPFTGADEEGGDFVLMETFSSSRRSNAS